MGYWRYAIDQQAYGPVSDEVIRDLAVQGVLSPMAHVLPEGSASWTSLYVHEAQLGLVRSPAGTYSVRTGPPNLPGAGVAPGGSVSASPSAPPTASSSFPSAPSPYPSASPALPTAAVTPPGGPGPGASPAGPVSPWEGGPIPPPSGNPIPPPPPFAGTYTPPAGYTPYTYGAANPTGQYASWWKRFLAILLDGLITFVPMQILFSVLQVGKAVEVVDLGGGEYDWNFHPGPLILSLLIPALYYGYLNGVRGQTVGKMATAIKVVDATTGNTIGFARGLGRWAIALPLALACGIGAVLDALWPLWDDRKQAIHDKVVRSIVVRT
jgi:uncharacterized RDD family membrane protein YckC